MSAYKNMILLQAPVAYYAMDDLAGVQCTDYSTSGQHGTYENGIALAQTGLLVSEPSGVSVDLDGVDDQITYGIGGLGNLISGAAQVTVSFWANLDVYSPASNSQRFLYIVRDGSSSGLVVDIFDNGASTRFYARTDAADTDIVSVAAQSLDVVHHYGAIFDFANDKIFVVIDGVEVTAGGGAASSFTNGVYTLGTPSSNDHTGAGTSGRLNASMAHLALFNYNLGVAGLKNHYAQGRNWMEQNKKRVVRPRSGLYSVRHMGL